MNNSADVNMKYLSDKGYEEYKKIMNWVVEHDTRERILQDLVIRPFLCDVFPSLFIIPVDQKLPGEIHDYSKYCGKVTGKKGKEIFKTPDLCICSEWKWNNKEISKNKYLATVEIKSLAAVVGDIIPFINLNDVKLERNKPRKIKKYALDNCLNYLNGIIKDCRKLDYDIETHLLGINKVIATNGVRWIIYKKDKDDITAEIISLGKYKYSQNKIEWNDSDIEYKELLEMLRKSISEEMTNNSLLLIE